MKIFTFLLFLFFNFGCNRNYRVKVSKISKTNKILLKSNILSFIDEHKTLDNLEHSGLNFSRWFNGSLTPQYNRDLYKNTYYKKNERKRPKHQSTQFKWRF